MAKLYLGLSHFTYYRFAKWNNFYVLRHSFYTHQTTINIVFSVACYLELHKAIHFYY